MNRPKPPSFPETPDELTTSYTQKLEENHAASQDQEQSLRIQVKEREAVIQYQKEQLAADQKQITKLEIKKTQLTTATTPAVLTPPAVTTFPSNPVGVAKASADDLTGPPAPITPLSSRTPSLSERIPNPKEFNRT
ncbi:hypothetical protein COCSADRAFT_158539 [Bipolaris sorokiniana ND90Pr]|uniref:Uncharacterized protein n=1 Tax=Cochliobolus sativus (strain ND90Pr / ATCC 201652) TaxID=665912 RepID=M2TB41_COCSN|nr:uncharacterized protein COCSADRAFT_158539 [Bipolaris sorokiniana ND90Pr]EMD66436.1 hypothetical protein COCSADRAFT_158539 [Bipolaris sorokiniana ND90Pr]